MKFHVHAHRTPHPTGGHHAARRPKLLPHSTVLYGWERVPVLLFTKCMCGAGKSRHVSKRATLAGMEIGLARAGLDDFFALLGTPPPVTTGSYNKHVASF